MAFSFFAKPIRTIQVAVASLFVPMLSTVIAGGPPQFGEFTVICESGNTWTAIGIVEDEDPINCEVTLGGLFEGHTLSPFSDGYFEVSIQLDPEESGIVTAIVEDSEGKSSDEAREYIQQVNLRAERVQRPHLRSGFFVVRFAVGRIAAECSR